MAWKYPTGAKPIRTRGLARLSQAVPVPLPEVPVPTPTPWKPKPWVPQLPPGNDNLPRPTPPYHPPIPRIPPDVLRKLRPFRPRPWWVIPWLPDPWEIIGDQLPNPWHGGEWHPNYNAQTPCTYSGGPGFPWTTGFRNYVARGKLFTRNSSFTAFCNRVERISTAIPANYPDSLTGYPYTAPTTGSAYAAVEFSNPQPTLTTDPNMTLGNYRAFATVRRYNPVNGSSVPNPRYRAPFIPWPDLFPHPDLNPIPWIWPYVPLPPLLPAPDPIPRPVRAPRPNPIGEPSPGENPLPRPRPRSRPRPNASPRPQPQPSPAPRPGTRPGTRPIVRPLPRSLPSPPPPRVRERKIRVKGGMLTLIRDLVETATEVMDFVDCLNEGLPENLQVGGSDPIPKMEAIWQHAEKIDMAKVIACLVYQNMVEDKIIGRLRGLRDQAQRKYGIKFPFIPNVG